MGLNDHRAFDAPDVEAALRPLGWSELCARLVAAQDFRRGLSALQMLGTRGGAQGLRIGNAFGTKDRPTHTGVHSGAHSSAPGSFHNGTARMLEHIETGNRAINSNSSTYGKVNQGTQVDSRHTSLSAFAERQADENSHD